jgi:hypothetical protein
VPEEEHAPVAFGGRLHQRRGAVGRGIIHNDDMPDVGWEPAQDGCDLPCDAIRRDDGSYAVAFTGAGHCSRTGGYEAASFG